MLGQNRQCLISHVSLIANIHSTICPSTDPALSFLKLSANSPVALKVILLLSLINHVFLCVCVCVCACLCLCVCVCVCVCVCLLGASYRETYGSPSGQA